MGDFHTGLCNPELNIILNYDKVYILLFNMPIMTEKEVKIIDDKKEINKIIEEKIKGKKLVFTEWYMTGLLKRGISEDKFNEVFLQFDKVKDIEIETLKKGDWGYELFYEMGNNTTISIGTIPKNDVLIIIHLIEYKRNLDYRFKRFRQ